MKTIALRVPAEIHRAVTAEAERQGTAVSTIGREILERGLDSRAGLAPDTASASEALRLELVGLGLPEMRRLVCGQIETGVTAIRGEVASRLFELVLEGRELCLDRFLRYGVMSLDSARELKGHEPLMLDFATANVQRLCDRLSVGWGQPCDLRPPDAVKAGIVAALGEPVPANQAGDFGWLESTSQDTNRLENCLAGDDEWRASARRIHDSARRLRRGRQAWSDWLRGARIRFGVSE